MTKKQIRQIHVIFDKNVQECKRYTGMFPVGDTSGRTLIAVCVCVRRHIAKLRQE